MGSGGDSRHACLCRRIELRCQPSPPLSINHPQRSAPHSHIACPLQVLAVLAYAHENDVEPFLEPALHLCTALLSDVGGWQAGRHACQGACASLQTDPCKCMDVVRHTGRVTATCHHLSWPSPSPAAPSAGPSESQKVIAALHLLLELAAGPEADTALAAAHCLLRAAHLHPADAAAVLATADNVALLVSLLGPAAPCTVSQQLVGQRQQQLEQQQGQLEQGQQQQHGVNAELAPLLLLVLSAVVEARPELLRDYGGSLRPAVTSCLDAVGDAGLRRRWVALLAGAAP